MAASHLISCILSFHLQQSLAIRTTLGDPCRIKETLRISYLEQRYLEGVGVYDTLQSGEFDFIHPSVWNGVTLATKTYKGPGLCSVDYAVHCTGSDVTLKLTDSCHKRTETRKMTWSRRTELHKGHSWFGQGGEFMLIVYPDGQERPIRMTKPGAWVEFRLRSPPTLKEQLEDPTKVRFFAQVPRVAACLPDKTDDIWKSNLHNGSYSAQQCAACLNLLESKMKETEVCGAAETSASKLRCQVLAAQMSKEGVLAEVVTTLQKSWNQRTEVMTMPLVWQLGCQDLGCCPLDPDVSKLLIEEATRSLDMEKFEEAKRETKPDSEEMSGVAERVLMDPKARLELESMLKTKAFNNQKNHSVEELSSDLSKMKVATSDSECVYNFQKGRCSPPGSCVYKYRFGDLTFDKSCRLKAEIIRPVSDADCLWNYRKMRCHHPQYCARRCKKDLTFDGCCKLRKVPLPVVDETSPQKISQTAVEEVLQELPKDDADDEDDIGLEADEESIGSIGLEADEEEKEEQPSDGDDDDDEDADPFSGAGEDEEEGNCLNDREVLSRPGFTKELEEDVRASLTWKLALNREKCHQKHVKRGLSELCASCFVDVADCALNRCFSKMTAKGALHPETKACMAKPSKNGQLGCTPALRKCSGLEESELPQPDH